MRPRLAIGIALGACCSPALAQTAPNPPEERPSALGERPDIGAPISYGVEMGIRSGHSDRGYLINDRPVIQPVTWVTGAGASFSAWSSFALARTTDGSLPQIVELELSRALEWGDLSIEPAGRLYFYHDPLSPYSTRSFEGWLYVSWALGPVSVFTNHSYDVARYRGAYFGEVGVESERELSQGVQAGGSVAAGWASARFNNLYAEVDARALNRMIVQGWLTAYVRPRLYVGPYFELSAMVDGRIREELARPTFVLLGLTTGFEF